MEQQQSDWQIAQAEELRAEQERWSAALEDSQRRITHLTNKEAELEKCTAGCSSIVPVIPPAGEPRP